MDVPAIEAIVFEGESVDGTTLLIIPVDELTVVACAALRRHILLIDGVGEARGVASDGKLVVVAEPTVEVTRRELLATLTARLQPQLATNVVVYFTDFTQDTSVYALGVALLEPVDSNKLNRVAEHLRNGLDLLGADVTVSHRESGFFVLGIKGRYGSALLQDRAPFLVICEEGGISPAVFVTLARTDKQPSTMHRFIVFMRKMQQQIQ